MIAFRFGADGRQLFAAYHPAGGGRYRDCAVLLFNPYGQDAIRTQRVYRVLAERLAQLGFAVMRFDYLGSGDSDADDEVVSLAQWTNDALDAHAELRGRAGTRACHWVGYGLGAAVASLAAVRSADDIASLLLWDPVIDGPRYLAAMRAAHIEFLTADFGPRSPLVLARAALGWPRADHEWLGFALSGALKAELAEFDLHETIGAINPRLRVHLLDGRATAESERFAATLMARGTRSTCARITSAVPWVSEDAMNAALVPGELLEHVCEQLALGP
jgi:pimeloyl-ACP methyl ester carboxylesterase